MNGTVRAGHLTQPASYTMMFVPFIVRHGKGTTETVKHLQFLAILRILLGYLGREELAHGSLQSYGQALDTLEEAAEISVVIFHYTN